MTNLECAILVLEKHREARQWTDNAVAVELLAQLGLDAAGEAVHATLAVDPAVNAEVAPDPAPADPAPPPPAEPAPLLPAEPVPPQP